MLDDSSVVVMFSGGIDSMLLCRRAGDRLRGCVFVGYGQPAVHEERRVAATYCREFDIPLYVAFVSLQGVCMGDGPSVIPARNGVLVSIGVNVAMSIGANTVWLGCNADDFEPYLDCRQSFVAPIAAAYQLLGVAVCYPLVDTTKAQILEAAGPEMVSRSWSCYTPVDGRACGDCYSCRAVQG